MARGAMRIGEVLKLTPSDVVERKLLVRNPKSGREVEIIFIPQKVADRLKTCVSNQKIDWHDRIFPICYEAARSVVMKAGKLVGINLRPHDLRCHAATYASRSGVPVEVISNLILRHSNLSTTQTSSENRKVDINKVFGHQYCYDLILSPLYFLKWLPLIIADPFHNTGRRINYKKIRKTTPANYTKSIPANLG